jgi:hypothetical protein
MVDINSLIKTHMRVIEGQCMSSIVCMIVIKYSTEIGSEYYSKEIVNIEINPMDPDKYKNIRFCLCPYIRE